MLDEFVQLYEHLPKEKRLAAAHADLLEGVKEGFIVAFVDKDDEGSIRYKHRSHCSPSDLDMALTPDQLEHEQAKTRARVAGDWN